MYFFVISIFKRDGLNCVPVFMNSNKEASKEKTVLKDPSNIDKIATPKNTIDRIIDVTAPNFNIALLPSEVVFDFIRSEQVYMKIIGKVCNEKNKNWPKY